METHKEIYSVNEVTQHIRLLVLYLRKKWLWLVLAIVIGAGLGLYYYYTQKPHYKAVSTFILEEKSGGGGLAGLASQFGVSLGSFSDGGNFFAGDNILDILKSKKVIHKVLLNPVNDQTRKNKSMVDFYLDFSGMRNQWKKNEQLTNLRFIPNNDTFSPAQDSVMNLVYENILNKNLSVERSSKQGSIIKVQVAAENSLFARLMTESLVDEASKLYLNIKVGRAETNIKDLQRRSDSLLYLLNRKSYTAAASQPLDINPAIKTATVPGEIASRDKTVLATLYAEVTKNLEASKLMLAQQTPVIQVLDSPGLTLKNQKKGIIFSFAAFILIAAVIWFIAFSVIYVLHSSRVK